MRHLWTLVLSTVLILGTLNLAPAMAFAGEPLLGTAAVQQGAADTLVCHARGKKGFKVLYVNAKAVQGHRKHGDGLPGEAFPGIPGHIFGDDCTATSAGMPLECPCFGMLTDVEMIARANAYSSLEPTFLSCEENPNAQAVLRTDGELFALVSAGRRSAPT